MDKEIIRIELEKSLPAIIARKEVKKYTGGMFSPRTLANEDSQGTGIKNRIKMKGIRGGVGYLKSDFIDWFIKKLQV